MIDFIYLGDYSLGPPPAADTSGSAHDNDQDKHLTDVQLLDPDSFLPPLDLDPPTPKPLGRKKKKAIHANFAEPDWKPEPQSEPVIGSPTVTAQSEGSLTMHARLHALAVKYDLADLKEAAVKKTKSAVRGPCLKEDVAKAIAVAFGATPHGERGMRDIIIQIILSCSADLVSDPAVERAISAVDGLPFELFKLQSTSAKRNG